MGRWMAKLARCQKGATAIEYGLIAALMTIALIGGMSQVGDSNNSVWGGNEGSLGDAMSTD